jgi:hypothetical protein
VGKNGKENAERILVEVSICRKGKQEKENERWDNNGCEQGTGRRKRN